MDTYAIWCDLCDGSEDLAFADAVSAYLSHLKSQGKIAGFRLQRRKLGFGPPELGEFFIGIETENLAQLEHAFQVAAGRSGEVESLHADVFRRVHNFRAGLYRDFPDPVRER